MPCSGICYLCLYYFWSEKKLSIISHYFTVLHLTTTKTCPIIYQYVYIELSVSGFNVTIMNNNDYKLEVYGLANIKSAKKRILVTETRAARNKAIRSEVKTSIKKVEAAVAANDKELILHSYMLHAFLNILPLEYVPCPKLLFLIDLESN